MDHDCPRPPLGLHEPGPYIYRLGPKAQAHLGLGMEPKPWALGQLRPQPFLATKKKSMKTQTRMHLLCLASGGSGLIVGGGGAGLREGGLLIYGECYSVLFHIEQAPSKKIGKCPSPPTQGRVRA